MNGLEHRWLCGCGKELVQEDEPEPCGCGGSFEHRIWLPTEDYDTKQDIYETYAILKVVSTPGVGILYTVGDKDEYEEPVEAKPKKGKKR